VISCSLHGSNDGLIPSRPASFSAFEAVTSADWRKVVHALQFFWCVNLKGSFNTIILTYCKIKQNQTGQIWTYILETLIECGLLLSRWNSQALLK
jgi:hypothetical protein